MARHVLGSNDFHYVRDPWGSFSKHPCDIDYIRRTSAGRPPTTSRRDSFYLSGPDVPRKFTINYEGGATWSVAAPVNSTASFTFSPGFTRSCAPNPLSTRKRSSERSRRAHAARELLDGVVGRDSHDLQVQRLHVLASFSVMRRKVDHRFHGMRGRPARSCFFAAKMKR